MKKCQNKPEFKNQKDLFLWIWMNRPHYSEVSGKYLGQEARAHFFAHCLPKSLSTRFRLDTLNIVLMTQDEHANYDTSGTAHLQRRFEWVLKLREHLKALDNQKL